MKKGYKRMDWRDWGIRILSIAEAVILIGAVGFLGMNVSG